MKNSNFLWQQRGIRTPTDILNVKIFSTILIQIINAIIILIIMMMMIIITIKLVILTIKTLITEIYIFVIVNNSLVSYNT